jgi:putative hydrolase of the HAD superfamily
MNIVFDFGGVLFRWQPHEFMPRLLPQRATDAASTHALVLAFFQLFQGDWGDFDRGTLDVETLAVRIAERVGLTVAEARRVIDAVPDELTPLPGTVDLLRRLHARGHGLFFLSNMPEPYARVLEARHGADFLGLFRRGLFSSRVGVIKPEPEIFDLAVTAFGVDPHATLFIDDVAKNLVAASAVGWRGVRFLDAEQCEAELGLFGAR